MSGKSRMMLTLLIVACMVAAMLAGCGQTATPSPAATAASPSPSPSEAPVAVVDFAAAQDSSDLPDWAGEQLKLVQWYAFGTAASEMIKSEGDVVWPEITRITGVSLDVEKSYDNGGDTMEIKLGKIMASNEWPMAIVNPDRSQLEKMAAAGLLWDLTGYVDAHCPNLVKNFPKDKLDGWWNSTWVNAGQAGKVYALPSGIQANWQSLIDPELDRRKWAALPGGSPQDPSAYFYIRDDILKQLFPAARSRDELEALYEQKNGDLTKEDILDVPINSKEDFIKLLYDIKALGVKEGGKEVYPTYTVAGANDCWHILVCLFNSLYGQCPNGMTTADTNYYSFWDKQAQKVDYMFTQPVFKDMMRQINQLVRDKVASPQAIIDNDVAFNEKRDGGLYAVTYAWNAPSDAALAQAGKPYKYRRVYINVKPDASRYAFTMGAMDDGMGVTAFVKSQVSEEQLKQVLRYFDLMNSETGFKLASWGPRTAGLWEEKDGKRAFKDKDLEACMVYNVENEKDIFYHLFRGINVGKFSNTTAPYAAVNNKYLPIYYSDKVVKGSDMMSGFYLGLVDPYPLTPGNGPNMWNYANDQNPGIKKFFEARSSFNADLIKTMTAKDDAQFDQFFQQMLDNARLNGATEEALALMDAAYKEAGKDFMQYLK